MSYSYTIPKKEEELCAKARTEGVDASFKDLTQVCGRIRGKQLAWAMTFLEQASVGKQAVLYKSHNKRLGHRKQLHGQKGRFPKKAAALVLQTLKSAKSNGIVKGLSEDMVVVHASANKKNTYPRLASKGRRARSNYETSRIEVVVKSKERAVEKKIQVKAPKKEKTEEKPKEEPKEKKPATTKPQEKPKETPKKEENKKVK